MNRKVVAELKDEIERQTAEMARLKKRRDDLAAKRVKDEKRRGRFLHRLDRKIWQAEGLKALAEANLAGIMEGVGDRG